MIAPPFFSGTPNASELLGALFCQGGIASLLPFAVVAWDTRGQILGINSQAEQMFGWHAAEVVGDNLLQVLPPAAQHFANEAMSRLAEGSLPPHSIVEISCLSGRNITCEWHTGMLADTLDGGRVAVAFGRDITRHRRLVREHQRLREASGHAEHSADLDRILLLLHEAAIEGVGVDRAAVWLLDGAVLRGTWGSDEQGRLRDEHDRVLSIEFLSEETQSVLRGERHYVRGNFIASEDASGSSHIFGLRAGGEMLGLLITSNQSSEKDLQNEDLDALEALASQGASAIAGARLMLRNQQLIERRRRLLEIASAINAHLSLDDILRLVRDAVVEEGVAERAGVYLVNENEIRGSWGTDENGVAVDEHHMRIPRAHWQPSILEMTGGRCNYLLSEDGDKFEIAVGDRRASHACVRLRTGGEVVGLLFVDNARSNRLLDAEALDDLLAFSDQAAVAVRNAQLLAERERHIERLRRLASLAAAVNASKSLTEILHMVRDGVVEAGGFRRAFVYLYDQDDREAHGTWGTDPEGNALAIFEERWSLDPHSDLPEMRVLRGQASYALTQDYTQQFHLEPGHPLYGVRSRVALPLRVGRDVVGLVCVDNGLNGGSITREDVEILLPFAEQAAVAIQNARLHERARLAQDALFRMETLRAVGELASGVAHNVNNVLSAVLNYAELIQDDEAAPPRIRQYARTIELAAMDGAGIVKRIQHFARREHGAVDDRFDLAELVREAVELTRPAWQNQAEARGVRIEVEMQAEPGAWVQGSSSEIREVMVNLINNAADAMPKGGRIVVSCGVDGDQAVARVRDSGVGMDVLTRSRIFEPFFTTKQVGKGLGLGLSVAWSIAERHGGRLEVESYPGKGTEFSLSLPRGEAAAPTVEQKQQLLAGMRILLVEDDEIVLGSIARALTGRGAEVALAMSGNEGLEWLAANSEACDIIVSDHGMVGMTGMEMLTRARELYPNLPRILLSGWGAQFPDGVDLSNADRVLAKPIRTDDLATVLLELTGQ